MSQMKLHDYGKWNKLIFTDRVILPKDLKQMAWFQVKALLELDVEPVKGQRGVYRVKGAG